MPVASTAASLQLPTAHPMKCRVHKRGGRELTLLSPKWLRVGLICCTRCSAMEDASMTKRPRTFMQGRSA